MVVIAPRVMATPYTSDVMLLLTDCNVCSALP